MSEKSEDLELFHYGVKGMKWGVRRPEGPDGRVKKSGGIRQRIKERDDSIKKSRDELPSASSRELKALTKSVKAKGSAVRNLRNPEARSAAKSATTARKEATRNRREVERSASRLTSKEMALKGALWAGPAIAGTATLTAATMATRKNAKIGREFTAGLFSDTRGLPAPGTIALQFIDGKWQ